MGQDIHPLLGEEADRLATQLGVAAALVREHVGGGSLSGSRSDLPTLQALLDRQVIKLSQTYELQSLGLAFGQILATELGLTWVVVEDEYGCDLALRHGTSPVLLFPLTMFSTRVEAGEIPTTGSCSRGSRSLRG